MAPDSIQSIYQKYKHDTNVLASWLATTAKALGYADQLSSTAAAEGATASKPAPKSVRLKGKARKQAKKESQLSAPATIESKTAPKHILAIKDFVPLAQHIANGIGDTALSIPSYFQVALDRVISVRKGFGAKLAGAGKFVDTKSDARHAFFVSILEKVRTTLQPLMSGTDTINVADLKGSLPTDAGKDKVTPLANFFDVLYVYETSAEFEAAPDISIPTAAETDYMLESEDDALYEALFAMSALMDDLGRLREEVAGLWAEYEAGKKDIAAVAVATNTAIELARSYEEEIKPLVQKQGGTSMFHVTYWNAICSTMWIDTEVLQHPSDDYNFQAYDIADRLFVNPLVNISAHVRSNPLGSIPSYNGYYGWYDEQLRKEPRSNRENYGRMKCALIEMLCDLPLVHNHGGPVEDQLVHGMMTTLKAWKPGQQDVPEVPIWFSFAATVYLDTLSKVKVGRGLSDMKRILNKIKDSVINLPRWCPERKNILKDLDHFKVPGTDHWEVDALSVIRRTLDRPYKKHTFLRRHPLHCGLWVHHMRCLFHTQGIHYAAVDGTILYTTQLYHALRQEQRLSSNQVWTDLETLQKMQGKSAAFIGDPPTTLDGYFNNLCLTMGTSITNFASNKRDTKVKVHDNNRPILKFKGLTSRLVDGRIEHGDRRVLDVEAIGKWIRDGAKERDTNQSRDETSTSPITTLAAAISSEIPSLEFDYFSMHNLCHELLLRIQIEQEKVTGPEFTKKYMRKEENLAFVVGYTFSLAAGKRGVKTAVGVDMDHVPNMMFFDIAEKVVGAWLEEGKGDVVVGN